MVLDRHGVRYVHQRAQRDVLPGAFAHENNRRLRETVFETHVRWEISRLEIVFLISAGLKREVKLLVFTQYIRAVILLEPCELSASIYCCVAFLGREGYADNVTFGPIFRSF